MTALSSKETKSQGKKSMIGTILWGRQMLMSSKFTSFALESTSSTASAPTSLQRAVALISALVLWSTLNFSTMRLLSSSATTKVRFLHLGPYPGRSIKHANFLHAGNKHHVICVPVQPDTLPYSEYDAENQGETSCVSTDQLKTYSFPENSVLKPLRMEAFDGNGARGEMPARICLLESNRTVLKTFILPDSSA